MFGESLEGARLIASLTALLASTGIFGAASLPLPAEAQLKADRAPCAATRTLAARIAAGTTIEGETCYVVDSGTPWVAIVKRIDNLAREGGAVRVRFAASDPGRTLVEGWRMSNGRGVVAAMVPRPGHTTVAYYQVRFTPDR